jgi:uncharacterized DUF497 family protein
VRIIVVWTDKGEDHILRHGVSRSDVDGVLRGRYYVRRGRERFTLIGTPNGRVLFVVLGPSSHVEGALRVTTARAATLAEKRLFERRGKGSA